MVNVKNNKKKSNQKQHILWIVGCGILILLSITIGVSIYNMLTSRGGVDKQIYSLQARVERLEFCVAKEISPCSVEKLKEWNSTHDFHEHFKPRFGDAFYN